MAQTALFGVASRSQTALMKSITHPFARFRPFHSGVTFALAQPNACRFPHGAPRAMAAASRGSLPLHTRSMSGASLVQLLSYSRHRQRWSTLGWLFASLGSCIASSLLLQSTTQAQQDQDTPEEIEAREQAEDNTDELWHTYEDNPYLNPLLYPNRHKPPKRKELKYQRVMRRYQRMLGIVENPGPFEHMGRQAKDILQLDTYDGFRLELLQLLVGALPPFMDKQFSMTHHCWMGSQMLPNGSIYELSAQLSTPEAMYFARMDSAERVMGRYAQVLLGMFPMSFSFQLSPESATNNFTYEQDIPLPDCYAKFRIGSGPTLSFNYAQSINPWLTLGGEVLYSHDQLASMSTYGGRWTFDDERSEATLHYLSMGVLSATYLKRLVYMQNPQMKSSEHFFIATELDYNIDTMDSVLQLGFSFLTHEYTFKTSVASNYRVAQVFEHAITPISRLAISLVLDHQKNEHQVGVMWVLSP